MIHPFKKNNQPPSTTINHHPTTIQPSTGAQVDLAGSERASRTGAEGSTLILGEKP